MPVFRISEFRISMENFRHFGISAFVRRLAGKITDHRSDRRHDLDEREKAATASIRFGGDSARETSGSRSRSPVDRR